MIAPAADRVLLFGGVYSNHLALEALLEDAVRAGISQLFCLGDVGAFGPHPDRSCTLLREAAIPVVQGNYDHAIGHGLDDCQCGYTDPRDNHFAALSYRYTLTHTSEANRAWMRDLPPAIVVDVNGARVHLCHGSPRRVNEFLWASTTSDAFLDALLVGTRADVLCVCHTGLPWARRRPRGWVVNVGALGRPPNDGRPGGISAMLTIDAAGIEVAWRRHDYDTGRLASEMRAEHLPEPFVETIESGWWTTCLEVLPAKERARGKH